MENKLIDTAKRVLSGSSPSDVRTEPREHSEFSSTQKHRYDYLEPLFGNQTIELVPLIEGRGKNSWLKVSEKIDALAQAKFTDQSYHDALYDSFELQKEYTPAQITGVVADVRRRCGLKPYASRLKINCEADFFGLFIVHEVTEDDVVDGKTKKKLLGYKPVFKLKPEE